MAVVYPPADWASYLLAAQEGNIATINADPPLVYNGDTGELFIGSASATEPGVVTTAAQTFTGSKMFTNGARSNHMASSDLTELTTLATVRDLITTGVLPSEGVENIADVNLVAAPDNKDRYIQSVTSGGFLANYIYTWSSADAGWIQTEPIVGMICYVVAQNLTRVYTAGLTWDKLGITLDHVNLINKGTNTHAQIDTHIAGVAPGSVDPHNGQKLDVTATASFDKLVISNGLNATSPVTGAIVCAGGQSCVKDFYCGGSTIVAGTVTASTVDTANTITSTMTASSTTDSISTATGAVIISGGMGLAKNLHVGGVINATTGLTASGYSALPASGSYSCYYVGGYEPPIAGRTVFGDGTGWQYAMAKRAAGVTTDMITFYDGGSISAQGNISAVGTVSATGNISTTGFFVGSWTSTGAGGTNQATAMAITTMGTVAYSATAGVADCLRMPAGTVAGTIVMISNATAVTINLYPHIGGIINNIGMNNPVPIPPYQGITLMNAGSEYWSMVTPPIAAGSNMRYNGNFQYKPVLEFDPTQTLGITDASPSIDASTGALTVAGGVGIGGSVNITGSLTVGGTPFIPMSSSSATLSTIYVGAYTSGSINIRCYKVGNVVTLTQDYDTIGYTVAVATNEHTQTALAAAYRPSQDVMSTYGVNANGGLKAATMVVDATGIITFHPAVGVAFTLADSVYIPCFSVSYVV